MILTAVAIMLPPLLAAGAVFWLRRQQKLDRRRSPLTEKLAHLPGEQLRQRMGSISDKIDEHMIVLVMVGPLAILIVLLPHVQWSPLSLTWLDGAVLAAALVFTMATVRKLVPLWREYRNCRDGMRAEIAVAQQLDRLQAGGCLVLHDLPAEKFNIDHVVLGTSAVFMVETKSRQKPGSGKASAQVSYDGKGLQFPGWAETKPLEQARAQARWLADYLRGETGETVPVVPVVCLPGWYVNFGKDAGRSDVKVINPKFMSLFTDAANCPTLDAAQRTRIVHALFKRYPELHE